MKCVLIIFLLCPAFLFAQTGINFENGLTWQQVKEKAKTENKYIFVDCFATWCGPCKQMDKNVYPTDSVGDFYNKTFISVRIQCDTSKNDDEAAKTAYADAHHILMEYQIKAFPTFLFLSPDGKLVHKGLGYQKPGNFISLGQEAVDPHKQYITLLMNYQNGQKDYSAMRYLASTAQRFNDKDLSQSIAADYIQNYLEILPDADFFTKENFIFIASYPTNLTSKERLFDFCLRQSSKVDTMVHDKGFSGRMIKYVLNSEEIIPAFQAAEKSGVTPDWNQMSKAIGDKFGTAYVEENVLDARVRWYQSVKDWKNYIKYLIAKTERNNIEEIAPTDFWGFVGLNSGAWDIFEHSENKAELQKALAWSDIVVTKMEPKVGPNYGTFMDTKANILYKLGKKDEALALEAKASALTPKDKEVQEAYQKMKEGKPTW